MKKFKEFVSESTLSDAQHAEKIRRSADHYRDNQHKVFHDDSSMKRLADKDHKDLHAIANHLEKGEYKQASKKAYNLDTLVKDQIPRHQYNHIDRMAYKKTKK